MTQKSLVDELQQLQLAVELIELGARLQVLETETEISRARLVKLYKEVRGVSPPKGMLPFSTDWFMTWQPNLHASLFHGFYRRLKAQGASRMNAFVKAYRFYLEHVGEDEPVLALTRAWTLVRFFESDLLEVASCKTCSGHFVVHAHTPSHDYVCGICQPPSRAGKTAARRKAREELALEQTAAVASLG
ncbi:MAG: flagellar transcriptional regulator FlhC [Gammaproteobacteria bacterium]|nr:flagellar transcriptional regulator FlhC [Halomonas sp. SF2003]MBR9799075.1 flagellar transcriptional regulator FlhC [Gammaproteobacteria bacterium]TCJ26151.1 flagellar transcriptional regulator FlhC [Halomonas sp. GDM18]UTV88294.1 flagellar transcriptional regulator FlhC [Cobetia litoralis]